MSQTYSPGAPPTSGIRLALRAVWAVFTLAALWYVCTFGLNAPTADEWEFVPVLVGQEPVGPWLWAQHNEHRLPLPRFVFVTLFSLTHDFRAGMILQVAVLSALAFGLMQLAARFRGHPDWPDAFFPVSLLHIGHWENFLLGYQICFVLFTLFTTLLVVVALRITRETAFRSGVQAGVLLLCTAMTGGSGLALIPPVGAWLLYLAVIVRKNGQTGKALALVALAALSVTYFAMYFVGYEQPANHPPPSRDPVAIAKVAGQVLAMAFGIGLSGVWYVVLAAELLLGIATVVLLVRHGKETADRPATTGLIAVAVGVAGMALAIGIGRATGHGLWSRYAMLSWPLLAAAYFAWLKFDRGPADKGLRKWVPAGLCMVATLAFLPNMGTGMQMGAKAHTRNTAMEAEAKAGLPAPEFVAKYFPEGLDAGQMDRGVRYIPLLREANLGIFAPDEKRAGISPLLWLVLALVTIGVLGRWFWHLGRAVQAERARELFRLQQERFEEQFVRAAAATGLPRGLRWAKCRITGDALLVRDSMSGGIVAAGTGADRVRAGGRFGYARQSGGPRTATCDGCVHIPARHLGNSRSRCVQSHPRADRDRLRPAVPCDSPRSPLRVSSCEAASGFENSDAACGVALTQTDLI